MDLETIARRFDEDGFVVVRQVFTPRQISTFNQALATIIRDVAPRLRPGDVYFEDAPDRPVKSLFRLERHDDAFSALLEDARLLNVVRAVYDDPLATLSIAMYFGKPARSGSVVPAHQDNAFQCWDPPEALTLTVAVDPSTCDNGVLVCQKGSHKLGFLPHKPSGLMGFSQMLIETPDKKRYPEVEIRMDPGDVCLHAVGTVHRSDANRTDQSRRQLGIGAHSSRARVDPIMLARRKAILERLHSEHG